ncbi:hypothetical protein KIW84_030018 [Lathyrus oleraceus]|uniref:B-like cyclin n=1 Tax=Pisum sativum TaxID=3888 RepID=A0A9D5AVP1_PEA|nr:hypothetical protein KIW84_030018 [Pisum sativum]
MSLPPMQPLNAQRSHIQQGISQANAAGGAANSQQAKVMASSHVARQGEQRGPPVQAVSRTAELFNSQPDQNWRPTSRMRGSLSGQQLTEDVRQRLIMPTSPRSLLSSSSISSQFKNLSKSALTSTISLLPNSNLDKSICNKSNAKRDTQQIIQPYLSDISDYLRTMEMQEKRRPAGDYMDKVQRCITTNMRRTLVDWLVEVADEYKLLPETLHLAVSYIDRFLSIHSLNRSKLQLLGVSAMLIASEYEEITPPKAVDFCQITDNTYELHEVLEMEAHQFHCSKKVE